MLGKVLFHGTLFFIIVLIIGCNNDTNSVSPDSDPKPPVIPGRVVINDSTFADSSMYGPFKLTIFDPVTSLMRFNRSVGYYYKVSITSDSNNTSFVIPIFSSVVDSTIGLMFNLFAEKRFQTDFFFFLGQSNGSIGNTPYHIGIGFDRNDSVVYLASLHPYGDTSGIKKNIAPIAPGKWYFCAVEYNFKTEQATLYLDGRVVGIESLPGGQIYSFNRGIIYRDGRGRNGPAPYYLNHVVVYKK